MKNLLYIILIFFVSCTNENIDIEIYHNKSKTNYTGEFYTTEYGGLNYYIKNDSARDNFFKIKGSDSIVININNHKYIAKPLVEKPYSRERNNSDFSYYIGGHDSIIIADSIGNLKTLLLFSEGTDMENLKEEGVFRFQQIKK